MFVFTAAESHAHLKKHEEFMSSTILIPSQPVFVLSP
jgi:hypothetical protein